MSRRTRVLAVVAAAAVVGRALTLGTLAPVVLGVVLVVANLLAWRWSLGRRTPELLGSRRFAGPVVIGWLAITILPVHNFSSRSSASAVSSVSLQPVLEAVVFGLVGFLALAVVRTTEPALAVARPPVVLFLLPIWILASTTWSHTPTYTWVRGLQMLVVAGLAWATTALGRFDRSTVDEIIEGYLRWFLRIAVVLVGLGFAFGPRYVAATAANLQRFTWIGAHPNGSGLVLSVAIVIAVTTPSSVLRLPAWARAAVTVGLLAAMYDNHSRAAWFCLALGLLVAFTLQGHLNRLLRWAGSPLLVAAAVAAVYFRGAEIWAYLLRSRGSEDFASGNGRRELWSIGVRSLETPFDWLSGLGYGISRTLFLEDAPWAGEAHNSVLALLVGVGVVGVVLLLAGLVQTTANLVLGRRWVATSSGVAMVSLLVLMVVDGLATDILAEPNIGYGVYSLVAAVSIVHASQPIEASPPEPAYDARRAVLRHRR